MVKGGKRHTWELGFDVFVGFLELENRLAWIWHLTLDWIRI